MPARRIFLAAPNAVEFHPIIDSIVLPAITEFGYDVVRMPNLGSPEVTKQILASVGSCDAMVAVVIGRNPNVFWELGLAYALTKPIVLLAEHDHEFGLLTSAARTVLRGNDNDTRSRLAAAVRAAVGD